MIDFVLSDALEDLQSTESLVIANEVDASSASANEIASRLNGKCLFLLSVLLL